MSLGRTALCMLLVLGGVAAAAVLVPRALHTLHTLHALELQPSPETPTAARGKVLRRAGNRPGLTAAASGGQGRRASADGAFAVLGTVALDTARALLVLAGLMLMLVARRAHRRSHREYALYELHLSTHDQAKRQDLEDMVEALANVVRVWPVERLRNGQPYLAFELICGVAPANGGPLEMEWSLNVRCEPESANALDAAVSAAYPDVRLGRVHGEQPQPRPGVLREPGYLMRFPQGAQLRLLADRRRGRGGVVAARAGRPGAGRGRGADGRPLPAHADPFLLRGARPAAVPPPGEQARAPGTAGTA